MGGSQHGGGQDGGTGEGGVWGGGDEVYEGFREVSGGNGIGESGRGREELALLEAVEHERGVVWAANDDYSSGDFWEVQSGKVSRMAA